MKLDDIDKKINVYTLIKICAHYSPKYYVACFVLTVLDGLVVPFMLFTVAKFIDAAITISSPNPETRTMLFYLGLTVLGYLYTQLGQNFKQYSYSLLEDGLRSKLKPEIIKKQFNLDYLLFESATTQDLLLRVTEGVESKFTKVIQSVSNAISVMIQVLGVLYVVAIFSWWIVLVYVFIMMPTIIFTFRNGKVIYQEEKKVGIVTRKMNYLSDLLTNRGAANERALFSFSSILNKRFMDAHLYRSNFNTKVLARETSGSMLVNVVVSIYTVFVIFVLSHQLSSGVLSVGLFTSIIGSLLNLSKIVSFQSSELILEFSRHHEYAKDFNRFIHFEGARTESNACEDELTFESLEIRDLWFKYSDSEDYVLKGVDLSLVKGKAYSLVGLNGAGKSTLVKIIVGLYTGYEGHIKLNGKELKTYKFSDLRKIFSVVSQDFAKYYITLKENINFDDAKGDISKELSQVELDDMVRNLPNQENSYLGKVYDGGVDVSGGEWQRIAIARAMYQNSPFMIMDEPTASLSPTAESMIYKQFMNLASDKTQLMISHRLGSTKITDEIIVLDNGKIIENGSHEELMKHNNVYAKLFGKQSGMYE